MDDNPELEALLTTWWYVQRKIVSLMSAKDYGAAVSEIEIFLSIELPPEIRSSALGYRSMLKEKLGDYATARSDLLIARSLVGPTYGRYVDELWLASLCEKENSIDEAMAWYLTALQTCLDGEGFSCGAVLKGVLSLYERKSLAVADRELCAAAAAHSWTVLGLPGQADTTDLVSVVSAIRDRESRNPRKDDGAN